MKNPLIFGLSVVLAFLVALSATATLDLTGDWDVQQTTPGESYTPLEWTFDKVVNGTYEIIDTDTHGRDYSKGVLSGNQLTAKNAWIQDNFKDTIELTFSPDGNSFTGFYTHDVYQGNILVNVKIAVKGLRHIVRPPMNMDSGTRFSSISGEVGVRPHSDETAWKPAKLSTLLEVDNHVRTGEDSSCILSFSDMTTFTMRPESEIILNTPAEKDSKLKLLAGKIWVNVKKMIKDGSMDIEMNEAVAGIKGTVLVCEENGGSSMVKVIEGTVSFTSKATGKVAAINAGEMATATASGLSQTQPFDVNAEKASWEKYNQISSVGPAGASPGGAVPSAAQGCNWSGWWNTSAGDMELQQSGGIVTGTYGGWAGGIQGNASGNKLIGRWSFRSETNSWTGDLEFNMSDDCKSFSGRSRSYGDWGNWTGTRILKRVVSEQFIANQRFGLLSPDYTRIAYTNSTPEGQAVVVAGPEGKSEGKPYKDGYREDSRRFSPDSKRLAYWAYVGDKRVAVVDGVEGKAYDEIPNWALTFSPDSQHIAYRAKSCDNGTCKWVMVLDGVEQPYYGDVQSEPVFSNPESGTGKTHIGYNIVVDSHGYVVVDGKKLELEGLGPVFSPDGKRLAYARNAAYTDETTYIVLDGVSTGNLGEKPTSVWFIYTMYFSPDSKRFAYDACPNGYYSGAHVIISDIGRSSVGGTGPVIFSPDSEHMAYKALVNNSWMVVRDGKDGNGYSEVGDPVFSPDSMHMAYIAKNDNGKFVVQDGNEGKNYSDVWALTISPDSKRIAYVAKDDKDGGKQFVVVDGREGKRYSVAIKCGPFFSPDSRHVIYITNNCYECGFKELVVVDEVEEKIPYEHAPILEAGCIVFDSNSTFHYLADNTYQTYLVKESLGKIEAAHAGPVATGSQAASASKDMLAGDWIMQGKQTGVENSDWKAVLTLKADGTLSWLQTEGANIGTTRTGTWEFDGTTLTMKWSSPKGGQITWTSSSVSKDGISEGTYTAEHVPGGTWSAVRSNSKGSERKESILASSLLGDWKMEGRQTGVENSDFKATLTLNTDGTLNWVQTEGANVGATRSGTWGLDGETLTLKWSSSKGGQITWISSSVSEGMISEGTYTAELVSGGTWSASR